MATSSDSWKEDIREKLVKIYGSESKTANVPGLTRLLFFLDTIDMKYSENHETQGLSPFWRTLRMAYKLNATEVLKEYADRMMDDAKECEKDPNFIAACANIYANMADPNDANFDEPLNVKFDIQLVERNGSTIGMGTGLARVWDAMTPATQAEVVQVIKTMASRYQMVSYVDECVSLLNKTSGTVVMIGLAAISLTWQCYVNLRRWWKGEISGKRCAKNCIDSLVEIGAGVGGGVAGACLGTMIFPGVGTFLGGVLGGLAGGITASMLVDRLTLMIFNLPKNEAADKAYKYMGVSHNASNDVVNKAFRAKALKHHPDKGGEPDKFIELQMQMAIIKLSRGEGL